MLEQIQAALSAQQMPLLVISGLLVALLFGASLLGTAIRSLSPAGLIRVAALVLWAAIAIRLTVPKSPEWFGVFGDFINPVLTSVTLICLAATLAHAQRQVTIQADQLREASKVWRIIDTPWISVLQFSQVLEGAMVELTCNGRGPALNVDVSVSSGSWNAGAKQEQSIASKPHVTVTALQPDVKFTAGPIPSSAHADGDLVSVVTRWSSVHGVRLGSVMEYRYAAGRWQPVGELKPITGDFVLDTGTQLEVD